MKKAAKAALLERKLDNYSKLFEEMENGIRSKNLKTLVLRFVEIFEFIEIGEQPIQLIIRAFQKRFGLQCFQTVPATSQHIGFLCNLFTGNLDDLKDGSES